MGIFPRGGLRSRGGRWGRHLCVTSGHCRGVRNHDPVPIGLSVAITPIFLVHELLGGFLSLPLLDRLAPPLRPLPHVCSMAYVAPAARNGCEEGGRRGGGGSDTHTKIVTTKWKLGLPSMSPSSSAMRSPNSRSSRAPRVPKGREDGEIEREVRQPTAPSRSHSAHRLASWGPTHLSRRPRLWSAAYSRDIRRSRLR